MIIQFACGFIASVGFAYLFNCPKSTIPYSSLAGAIGWVVYYYSNQWGIGPVFSTLLGTIALSFVCEILARYKKDAITVFVIPAILPLVPGAGLFDTILNLIEGNQGLALQKGLMTAGSALSIAIGIILVSSFFRIIYIFGKQ